MQAGGKVGRLDDNRLILLIADSWSSKASEIRAAAPDLVIAAVPYQEAAVVEILKAGIRFLGLAPRTLDDIYSDIALISGCVGAGERGAKVISEMQAAIGDMRRQTAGLPRKRVFSEEWGKPVIASQPWVAELVEAAGGDFLGKPGAQCSAEEIARLDPEVIIGLLHLRRTFEHSRPYAGFGSARLGQRDSSRRFRPPARTSFSSTATMNAPHSLGLKSWPPDQLLTGSKKSVKKWTARIPKHVRRTN